MAKYKPGEIVDIVGGTYRKYKTGMFQRKAGLASASITVHGIEETHSIRLASIRKRPINVDEPTHVDAKKTLKETLEDIEAMTKQLKAMELRVKHALDELE